jgi:SAM-dependent methyltransferase
MKDFSEKNLYISDAHFYDLDNREITKVDIPFYLEYASKIAGNILELACGTGRITIPLAEVGHEIWGLEYSEAMIKQFKNKISELPKITAVRIHLSHGDMSNFSMDQEFPLILLPCRSFQLLLEEELERACLNNILKSLTDNGIFIIDVGNFVGTKERERTWVDDKEVFDWENTDPKTGNKIHRTHIKKEIDTFNQIIYPRKIYRVTKDNGSVETVVKRSPWKYFFMDQIRELITSSGFEIVEEMGSYNGEPISENGPEFIFICRKKL